MSSVRLTPVMRPIHPTVKRSGGMPIIRRARSRVSGERSTRSSTSTPRRITVNFSRGATPSATRSSRTSGLTATSAVVVAARLRSSIRKKPELHRAEVAAEDVPVERVDDDRWPCVARQQRGGAADCAGLGRMRVEDVRADAAG